VSLPNKLSVLRILLVPAIVATLVYYEPQRDWLRLVAFGLFLLAALSDALDGIIARTTQQESQLGALLDPIADKLLILGTLIACSNIDSLPEWMRIPAWFNLIVISRDALVLIGALVLFMTCGRWGLRPDQFGKWATFSQMMVIPAVMLHWPIREPIILAASALTLLSAISYLRLGLRLLS
jgi:CDP-diacylglycerol--glycerol-3-phosphate 3-phosphatidyltransferase